MKWIAVLKRDKLCKEALRRVLTMWTKRRFTRAFRTWAGRLYLFKDRRQAAKRLQRIKASVIHHIQQRSCSRALRTWRAYGSSCRALDRKLTRNVFTLKKSAEEVAQPDEGRRLQNLAQKFYMEARLPAMRHEDAAVPPLARLCCLGRRVLRNRCARRRRPTFTEEDADSCQAYYV